MFRTIGSPGFPFDEAEVRRLATLAYDRGFNPTGTARQLVAILASGSRTERLRDLRLPTLVIHGKDDPLVPFAAGEDTAEADSRRHPARHRGHGPRHAPPGLAALDRRHLRPGGAGGRLNPRMNTDGHR